MSARSWLQIPGFLQQTPINVNASGTSTLVAGQAGKQIKVYRLKLIVAAAVTIYIQDGSTVLDGPLSFAANEGMVLDLTGLDMPPWYTTSPGNALVMNCGSTVQIGGNLDYLVS